MSDADQKAREVLKRLVVKPDLFYAVLRIVADEYEVVSPWTKSGQTVFRLDVGGSPVASVFPASATEWQWSVPGDGSAPATGKATTEQGACGFADKVLRDMGFLLG